MNTSIARPFEGAVDAGQAQHRVGAARRLEQHGVLGELADLGAHPVAQLDADLDVAGLVPAWRAMSSLSANGTASGRGRVAAGRAGLEVVARAAGALERLDLADEDAVHQRPRRRRWRRGRDGVRRLLLRGLLGVDVERPCAGRPSARAS